MIDVKGIEVIVRCDGAGCEDGGIYDPSGFWKGTDDMSEAEFEAYAARQCDWLDGEPQLPAQDVDCPKCEGTGEIRRRVTLGELKALLDEATVGRSAGTSVQDPMQPHNDEQHKEQQDG